MPDESPLEQIEGPVLVSSCLLGISCRYDGSSKTCSLILRTSGIIPISICPERLGGLPTPRPSASFVGGDGRLVLAGRALVLNTSGENVTEAFIHGAGYCCSIASAVKARHAILKEGSPSCGTHRVWVEGEIREGLGITAAMLHAQGIILWNEDGLKL
jgi:uncharacterized protein YbbK (DUF523 family)